MKSFDYGIDAPNVLRNLAFSGFLCLVFASLFPVVRWLYSPAISLLATAGLWLYGSKIGKLHLREKLMKLVQWKGDELVLDEGCGSGLLLNAAAKRITVGRAYGVDIWRQEDLAGNDVQNTLNNAHLEGVADRVEVKDGDVRSLPFEAESMDVAISLNVVHNISERQERDKAINEILRVLKPGGQFIICDFRNVGEYVTSFRGAGAGHVEKRFIGFVGFFPMFAAVGRKLSQKKD